MKRGLPLKIAVVCSSLLLVCGYIWYQTQSVKTPSPHSASASPQSKPSDKSDAQGSTDVASLYPDAPPSMLSGSKSKSPLFTLPIKRETYVSGGLPVGSSAEPFIVATSRPFEHRIQPAIVPVNEDQLGLFGGSVLETPYSSPQVVMPKSKDLSISPQLPSEPQPDRMLMSSSKFAVLKITATATATTQPAAHKNESKLPKAREVLLPGSKAPVGLLKSPYVNRFEKSDEAEPSNPPPSR
jgi:hypothetical protein